MYRTGPIMILALTALAFADTKSITVSGRVRGASGGHTIHVALWDADGFLRKPVQETRLAAGADTHFQFVLQSGRCAVGAFEDKNENGVLDQGMFGPKEPAGFWRSFKGWHKPRFDEVASTCDRTITDADITLK
jgi:uncharacterized protein (DUF2141 family)